MFTRQINKQSLFERVVERSSSKRLYTKAGAHCLKEYRPSEPDASSIQQFVEGCDDAVLKV